MKRWKRALVWTGVAVAVLFFVPFLIPMSAYIKQAEELAAAKLGVPVSIGSLRVALLPSPRINVGEVVVGKNNEFSVEYVSVVPALTSLLSDAKVISSVQVKKPVIKKAALDILANLSKQPKDASSTTTVSVRQINVEDAKLEWPGLKLPEINADITLTPENKPEAAEIETVDGKLKLDLIPKDDRQLITLVAKKWTLPAGPPLLVDELRMEMVLTDSKLDIPKIDATLYGGKLSGDANLTWGKVYKLTGKTRLDNLAVREPARLMSKSTRVSGQLFSDGSFNATAKEAGQLADKLNADIKFNIKDGMLYGFDLAKAPAMLLTRGQLGGETKFDELSGLLNISGKTYRFRNLKVRSGVMSATGAVKISPNKALDGEIEVEVKNSLNLASIPLQVSGTLDKPMVLPTKAALAGAIAGTAVLGPAGAGIGLGVADKIKGLFGGDKDK
ncbi:MAG TPA: AsmA family protein [Methylophilaceae bacterium]|nr:AsmA family protein [Methylophilaceae bacterium]